MIEEQTKIDKILTAIMLFVIGGIPYIGMTFLTVYLWRIANLPAFNMPSNFFVSLTMFITFSHNPYCLLMVLSVIGSWASWWFICKVYSRVPIL